MFGSRRSSTSDSSQTDAIRTASSPDVSLFAACPSLNPMSTKGSIIAGSSCAGVKFVRKEKRSCSDGPLTSPFRFMLYPPSSPIRRFRKGSTGSDGYLQKLDFRMRGYTLPSKPCESGWPLCSLMSSGSNQDVPQEEECYRLRSFNVTSKGIVHLGDLFRHRSKSTVSLGSDGSSSMTERDFRDRENSSGSTSSSYRVLVMGNSAAGKSTLVSQFLRSSENTVHAEDDDEDEEEQDSNQENTVSVLLSGEESELSFVVSKDDYGEIDVNIFNSMDAVTVVYSIADRESFLLASKALEHLYWLNRNQSCLTWNRQLKAIILVGNKADLERSRVVSTEEGRNLANRFNSKFIETSGVIGHNVNELLVGILSQIRLQVRHTLLRAERSNSLRSSSFGMKARGLMSRLMSKYEARAHSCDNLNIL